jgi:hypothetical protein
MPTVRRSFYDTLTLAIADITEHGFDSEGRIAFWTDQLRQAAAGALQTPAQAEEMLRAGLTTVYRRLVERGEVMRRHPGVSRFTLARIAPRLRAELDRRILASANLIRLNRDQAINTMLRRFAGWATSIPAGGAPRTTKKGEAKDDVRKALASLPFEERRVLVDQGHKLTAAINEIVASDGGAVAAVWKSNWRQPNYDYRDDHKARDGRYYLLRGSWADAAGLVKPGRAGYYDEVIAVGQEPFCRCYLTYVYALSALPKDMLTKKGEKQLEAVRKQMRHDSVEMN